MQISYLSQRWNSSVHSHCLGCSQWAKIHSASRKLDFKFAGRGCLWLRRVSRGTRAEGIGSKFLRGENMLPRGFIHHTRPVYLAGAGDGKWKLFSSSQDFALSNHSQSGMVCDPEFSTTKMDDSLQGSIVSVNTGAATDFGQLAQMTDSTCFRIPQKPSAPLGWLSLGSCGNALIMRVGSDARCFHHHGLPCGLVDFGAHTSCGNTFYATTDVKSLGWSCPKVGGTISEFTGKKGVSLLPGKPVATKSRQNKQKKDGKTAASTRDLYERSSFHLLEVLFCFPFLNPNAVASNFQILSRKSLKELTSILNQTAIGLAGVSATWVFFVGTRTVWLDVSLDKYTVRSLAIGFGFLVLSWAMKRMSEVLKCLADRSRTFQQDYITGLQKELQDDYACQ
ncbi:hypothetical protein GOP47_0016211 [Adiantum capillus-veneris]|uniref:Transmembrane protein n=1 Tax=Adiantum capillus-veneris TaxID=13818 RepID=A0A9D4UH81_ADICA|nr:hypothetical protein GOP47_0016211 [Adiantum capillus-veneris]